MEDVPVHSITIIKLESMDFQPFTKTRSPLLAMVGKAFVMNPDIQRFNLGMRSSIFANF